MKIIDIIRESEFDSNEKSWAKVIREDTTKILGIAKNFDLYVQLHGTNGANARIDALKNDIDESFGWFIDGITIFDDDKESDIVKAKIEYQKLKKAINDLDNIRKAKDGLSR